MNEMRRLMEAVDYFASNNTDVRKVTNKLHELMDEGMLDPRAVADAALTYMSESDVAEMARMNEIFFDDEDEEDDDYDDEDEY